MVRRDLATAGPSKSFSRESSLLKVCIKCRGKRGPGDKQMTRTASILLKFDAKKGRMVNINGTSDWWKQIDTDTIISPRNRRYDFYIMGEQDLLTGEWKFYYHAAEIAGYGARVSQLDVKTPGQAQAWYEAQK